MKTLMTRKLGRTQRLVTTLGLGGQASLMLTPAGVDPVAIIEKAYLSGVTYFDTSNAYGPSQGHYGTAFRKLGLVPGLDNYDQFSRERIYLASKTHMRTTRHPAGTQWRNDYSDGMTDGMGVTTAIQDVRRTLSLIFGDGKGSYPAGAYLDSMQIHNITAQDDVDMIFEGIENPSAAASWLGALIGLLDLRDGTNRSGANPSYEKLIRHIGITGHWDSAALIYAVQRDTRRILDTLLVALNPSDLNFFCHQHNAIPVARAADMGIVAMKVFTDASYFGEPPTFMRDPTTVYREVGSTPVPSALLIQYALSIPGVTACLTGIGQIDPSDDPGKCQLTANILAAQLDPLSKERLTEIEELIAAAGVGNVNNYFQRPFMGLTPPRNVGIEADPSGFSPVTPDIRLATRISWDTAYAGRYGIEKYEVLRDGKLVGSVPHKPQWTSKRFTFEDILSETTTVDDKHSDASSSAPTESQFLAADVHKPRWTLQQSPLAEVATAYDVGEHVYVVRAVDANGDTVDSGGLVIR